MFLPTNRFLIVHLLQWLSAISTFQTSLPIVSLSLIVGAASEEDATIKAYECHQSTSSSSEDLENDVFPPDFLFGTGVSAYQTEGAWNESGKGESMIDRFVHTRPELIVDHSTGDIAADSYHKYKEDVQLIKQIKSNAYKFSIAWTRILPDGFANNVNQEGIEFYNNFINELVKNDITPVVALYHWDLPQRLSELGGWTNPNIVDWIEDYARVVFGAFGDRVKLWATINEPAPSCIFGYGYYYNSVIAPGLNMSGIADYMCGHNALLAHLRIYELYNREFRSEQKGKVGLVASTGWYVPQNRSSSADIEAADRCFQFDAGWFLHPIFTAEGDYPPIMKSRIMEKSKVQGFPRSRLPTFTEQEVNALRGAQDFLGVNFYAAEVVRNKSYGSVSYLDDVGEETVVREEWANQPAGAKNTPWAFEKLLSTLNNTYNLSEIYITETGYEDQGEIRDVNRTIYYNDHLQVVLKAINSGINIKGYFPWSLIDNYEWYSGYTRRFGLFSVDFNDPARPRSPRLSSSYITELYSSRQIPDLSTFLGNNEQH